MFTLHYYAVTLSHVILHTKRYARAWTQRDGGAASLVKPQNREHAEEFSDAVGEEEKTGEHTHRIR